jgi:hypothetical protein
VLSIAASPFAHEKICPLSPCLKIATSDNWSFREWRIYVAGFKRSATLARKGTGVAADRGQVVCQSLGSKDLNGRQFALRTLGARRTDVFAGPTPKPHSGEMG